MGLMAQQRLEVIAHGHRAFQHRIAAQALGHMAPGHFQYRLQLRKLRRPQAQLLAEHRLAGFQQRAQTAKLRQQMARQVHRAPAGYAGAQEDRQQFSIGQTRSTPLQKLLSRPLCRRPITNTHSTSLCMCAAVAGRALCYRRPSFLRAISPGEGASQASLNRLH